MAEAVVMPKLGNTVESVIILAWRAAVGDFVQAGDPLCEVETDKAAVEVESSASGLLLARYYEVGDEAPVLSKIALIGEAGEAPEEDDAQVEEPRDLRTRISPRARNLAERKQIDYSELVGSGPEGRVIERDIEAAIRQRVTVSPLAQAMLDSGDFQLPDAPAGARVTKSDLLPAPASSGVTAIPLRGARKTIARRMLESLQNSAQLTLHASADARALQDFRKRLKASDESHGLREVTINHLLLFAVARSLPAFPGLNALFADDTIYQYEAVHLAQAVDTDRGLLAPVIRDAEGLSLRGISDEARRLAAACRDGSVAPGDLAGGTFTVSNLGALGIETFTPVLNPPQVGILGVGAIQPRAVPDGAGVEFVPHIALSLTINHQVVDGAPAARFLQRLCQNLAQIDLLAAT